MALFPRPDDAERGIAAKKKGLENGMNTPLPGYAPLHDRAPQARLLA